LLALEDRIGEGETATALRSAGEALMAALDALARWDSADDLTDEEVERRIAAEEERSRQEYLEEQAEGGRDDAPQGEGSPH
jgi:hypothetical protein